MKNSYGLETNSAVEIGQYVIYGDPVGTHRPAIVTAVWGPNCINVVFVNDDENQTDSYGRKLERATSVMHRTIQEAHGNFWFDPENPTNELPKTEEF